MNVRQTAHFSGEYKRWTYSRQCGVAFYMRTMRVPHLSDVLAKHKVKSVRVELNGEVIKSWKCVKDKIYFRMPIFRGNYSVYIEVVYDELEGTRYTYEQV